MARKTPVDRLSLEVQRILAEYGSDAKGNLSNITAAMAKKGAQTLRQVSKQKFKGDKYRKSWTTDTTGNAHRQVAWSNVIYSRMPGLPHLLEHGHAKRGGGRVEGREHIAPVEEALVKELEQEVLNKL